MSFTRQITALTQASRVICPKSALRRAMLSFLAGGAFLVTSQAMAKPSLVTLIDLYAGKSDQQTACSSSLVELRNALDSIGIPTSRPAVPTADALRMVLSQVANQGGTGPKMVVVCGEGMALDGQLFIAPADLSAATSDLSRKGVSADTFSRVAGPGSLTALDISALPGATISSEAGDQWTNAAPANTSRLLSVEHSTDTASLVHRLTAAAKGHGDVMFASFLGVPAGSAQPSAPVVEQHAPAVPPQPAKEVPAPQQPVEKPTPAPEKQADNHAATSASTQPQASNANVAHVAAPKPAPHPKAVRRLVKHYKPNPELHQAQLGLLANGYYHGQVSGFNNAATVRAIRDYQKKVGHPVTGKLTADEQTTLTGGK
ncbi:peptidoglycan-binding domain-containing protein [Swingsia samuiensis]|uniref:Peptidoglycan binding-like domain-containing protein n=1 Tax=Swingsia samuiensis TaxID=1293412 RepID=A0A4Y6UJY7_9PROT|nr:peptidoglycan-binding domain-containing protein [Swingsia samuiensis]QDH16315.1 hypothetical protein E3D00_01045 [Swingsia samuiensis]